MSHNKNMENNNQTQFISTAELAKLLHVSRIAVFKKIQSGKIKAFKVGRNYVIPMNEVSSAIGTFISPEKKTEIDQRVAAENGGLKGSAMVSDAFFPFADNIEIAAAAGIKAIVAPQGSIRDEEVIAMADAKNIALYFIETRHFRH